MPMEFRSIRWATKLVVPEPINGSSTVSPGWVNSLINHSGKPSGKAALLFSRPFLQQPLQSAQRPIEAGAVFAACGSKERLAAAAALDVLSQIADELAGIEAVIFR